MGICDVFKNVATHRVAAKASILALAYRRGHPVIGRSAQRPLSHRIDDARESGIRTTDAAQH